VTRPVGVLLAVGLRGLNGPCNFPRITFGFRYAVWKTERISSDERCGYVPAGRVIPPSESCLLPVNRRI